MTRDEDERYILYRYHLWWDWWIPSLGWHQRDQGRWGDPCSCESSPCEPGREGKVIHWGAFFWWMVVNFECLMGGQIRENEDEMVRIEMPKVVRRSCREVEVRHNWSQDPSNFQPCSLHYCFFCALFLGTGKIYFWCSLENLLKTIFSSPVVPRRESNGPSGLNY